MAHSDYKAMAFLVSEIAHLSDEDLKRKGGILDLSKGAWLRYRLFMHQTADSLIETVLKSEIDSGHKMDLLGHVQSVLISLQKAKRPALDESVVAVESSNYMRLLKLSSDGYDEFEKKIVAIYTQLSRSDHSYQVRELRKLKKQEPAKPKVEIKEVKRAKPKAKPKAQKPKPKPAPPLEEEKQEEKEEKKVPEKQEEPKPAKRRRGRPRKA